MTTLRMPMPAKKTVVGTILLIALVAFFSSAVAAAQEKRPTARERIGRIQKHVGVTWRAETVDTFKAGNPDSPVTGIAVTMMATMDVLERAAAAGDNLIITHEPTFFDHLDISDDRPKPWKCRGCRLLSSAKPRNGRRWNTSRTQS